MKVPPINPVPEMALFGGWQMATYRTPHGHLLAGHETGDDQYLSLVAKNTDYVQDNEYQIDRSFVTNSGIIVDLGASFGDFAFACLDLDPKVKVLAVEGDKWRYAELVHNIISNHVEHRIVPAFRSMGEIAMDMEAGTSLVELLDEFEIPEVDFLKVDIESSEAPLIMYSSEETLRRVRRIAMEVHGREVEGIMNHLRKTHDVTYHGYVFAIRKV
jgi:tRNA G37 N-methylase Trm5